MKQILIAMILILLMNSIATAEQIEDWNYTQRNEIPSDIEGVRYDFEEGSHCALFNNKHPDIVTFLAVVGTRPYGSDIPSYVEIGGTSCRGGRCKTHIYPWCGYHLNGTPYNWVFVVVGEKAFAPITGPDEMGGYWPGTEAELVFKEGTRHISFVASTGGTLSVALYDAKDNLIHATKIYRNIDRNGTSPSDMTYFRFDTQDKDIKYMKLYGRLNAWHIDDLIIGGELGYLSKPVDYSDVVEKALSTLGAKYLEFGLGYDYRFLDYADVEDIINPPKPVGLEYWNPDTKQFEYGKGISDEGLIILSYNSITKELYGESVVKWDTSSDMCKHDFTESVPIGEEIPGDVYFMYGEDYGVIDEVGMVVNDNYVITSRLDRGVMVLYKPVIEGIGTPNPDFAGYHRLPGKINGGHSPIKKHPPIK